MLFRSGRFADVTEKAGLGSGSPQWAVSAGWLDYDNDGRLDLFVSNYVEWEAKSEPRCGTPERQYYCHPNAYRGLPNQLFHNNGDGTFTDVSKAAGIAKYVGKGMGVAFGDMDGDGMTDIFVANDSVRGLLFRNLGDGTFAEMALEAGVARIGTDLFHQPLLAGMDWLLPVPTRFRTTHSWADLVREGVLDGALVSGLELQTAGTAELGGLHWVELGRTSLALAMSQRHGDACSPSMPPVLVPNRGVAPGLQRALQSQGLDLQSVGLSCTSAET